MRQQTKKTGGRRAIKITLWILGGIFLLMVLLTCILGVRGYRMYQDAIQKTPIAGIADTVKSKDGFTRYEDLPEIYVDAVISVEDSRFESHCGIDLLAIARAAWTDLKTLSFVEGGSTITQQIAKNHLFTRDKKIERKIAEVFAAFALEKEYSKQELFEIYANSIYFGNSYYGIYEAAQGYFQKTPQELTDYEAVLLAGLPNAPTVYSPDTNMELAKKRASVVLQRMIDCGKLTVEEAGEILSVE